MQVILDNAATNTLYLSALYNMSISDCPQLPISVAAMFIQTILYENPVWDIGLQHKIVTTNLQKIFNMEANKVDQYISKCICPCGVLFWEWHIQNHINELPNFHCCDSSIFKNHLDFIAHLYEQKDKYYHVIILRLVQSTYSILLAKFRQKSSIHTMNDDKQTFSSIHKGKVPLTI